MRHYGRLPSRLRALRLDHAVLITETFENSPAAKAGIRPGDVIVEMQGEPLGPYDKFLPRLQGFGAGQIVTLKVLRGSENLSIDVTLGRLADNPTKVTTQDGEKTARGLRAHHRSAQPSDICN